MALDLLKQAEETLNSYIQNWQVLRHAAETQGILLSWGVGVSTQVAALLVPLVRENILSEADVAEQFGHKTIATAKAALEYGFQRPSPESAEDALTHIRKLRNLFTITYLNLDAALLCTADRLAGLYHLNEMTPDQQRRWAQETQAVDLPLLHLLGLMKEYRSLSDLCLYFLDRLRYVRHEAMLERYYREHEARFKVVLEQLHDAFSLAGVYNSRIQLVEVTPSGLQERVEQAERRGVQLNTAALNVLELEVILPDTPACYTVLGVIHALWEPSRTRGVIDEIANARYNGYRALKTHVHDPDQTPMTFTLMSEAMADSNLRGVLTRQPIKNAWWNRPEIPAALNPGGTRPLNADIAVFTPTGEVVFPLRRDTTLLDVAFRVHSELGQYTQAVYMTGRRAGLNTLVRHREIIEITFDRSAPQVTPDWLEYTQNKHTQKLIRRALRPLLRHEVQGRTQIESAIQRESELYGLRFSQEQIESGLAQVCQQTRYATREQLYEAVARGEFPPSEVAALMIEAELSPLIVVPPALDPDGLLKIRFARTWLQARGKQKWHKALRVLPGVPIVGRMTAHGTLTIHRADSPSAPKDGVALAWHIQREAAQVNVTGYKKLGTVRAVVNSVYSAVKNLDTSDLTIDDLQVDLQENFYQIQFTLEISDSDYWTRLNDQLASLRRANFIHDFTIWTLFAGQRQLLSGLYTDRRRANPYTHGHIQDREMFFGRQQEIRRVVDHLNQNHRFIVLHGHKRIGKTSLMHHLAQHVLPNACDVIPVTLDIHGIAPFSAEDFALALVEAAAEVLRAGRYKVNPTLLRRRSRKWPLSVAVHWVAQVEKELNGKRLCFLIDEFTSTEEAYRKGYIDDSFFQQLQHIVDNGELTLILCIHDTVLRDPYSKLQPLTTRAEMVRVEELEQHDADALIRQPMSRFYTLDPAVIEEIHRLTHGHPYIVHVLCHQLMSHAAHLETTQITLKHLASIADRLMRSIHHYFDHYQSATNEAGWKVIKTIAQLSYHAPPDGWVTLKALHEQLADDLTQPEIEQRCRELYSAGAVARKWLDRQNGYQYRVQVGLLDRWLREGTHQLTAKPMIDRITESEGATP
jgi:GTP pyrophosphokinase